MPTYTYKREDGSLFELDQRITEDAIAVCPTTGQKVKRVISGGAGLVFKGSGFYLTDYGKAGGGKPGNNGSKKSEGGAEESNSKESDKSESKAGDGGGKKEKVEKAPAKGE